MNIRSIIVRILFLLAGFAIAGPLNHLFSQDPVTEALKQLSSENVTGYVRPVIDGFGANLNAGLYHTEGLHEDGFRIQLSVVGSGMLIGERQRYYYATPPEPFDPAPVRTATILGGTGTTVTGPGGVEYQFQNGQLRTDVFGLGVPQLTVGNLFGTEAIFRYAVAPSVKEFPGSSLIGIGGRHSLNRHIPRLPLEVTVGAFWQEMKTGGIIDARSTNVALVLGKSVSMFTMYGGVQFESTEIDIEYTYTGYGSTPDSKVNLHYGSADVVRWMTGFGLRVMALRLYTEIGIGKVTVVTGTIGFGL